MLHSLTLPQTHCSVGVPTVSKVCHKAGTGAKVPTTDGPQSSEQLYETATTHDKSHHHRLGYAHGITDISK